MSTPNDDNLVPVDDAEQQLVAYLDGELSDDERIVVEARLADDYDYRQRLQRLERAWDMLDSLPRMEASGSFVHTTVEMISLAASQELETIQDRRKSSTWRVLTITLAASLIAAVAGFAWVNYSATSENQKLLTELPLIENMDRYQKVDEVEFLEQLRKEGLFVSEVDDGV
ncbi:hypothetical protein LOC68_11295 [Blastopirellula sp. JC732]|uniref:Putative zinc-finger domain-containing protein n=1 Tax=Blastopirellula sediminis TaxID=2894196 RepID=A0A9X1MP08_9BACT|nr:zf-HC2 domain-containing protein [Blastopirellula sediminis]MCC9609740.1 hypothetical protein [Blastopirellula sediminis]MCC9628984.1 hypothetical protein [Blastopirellula sediminis]